MRAAEATSAAAKGTSHSGSRSEVAAHAWEEAGSGQTAWERAVQEDEHGRLVVDQAVESFTEAVRRRRKRLEQNDYSQRNRRIVRDMIRYVYVLIDASRWMRLKDPVLPPGTRLEAIVPLLQDFVQEYYDQNPLSHIGLILVKDGEAEILSPLSSNSKVHRLALQSITPMALLEGAKNAGGEFSLQNGLEVAGRSLGHQPRHGSREVVVVTAALSTCDPGYVLTETLPKLLQSKIRVSCFALSAELHVCRKMAEETGGIMGVCLDKAHCRDWLFNQCIPPPALKDRVGTLTCDMIHMGFPTRTASEVAELVHASREKTLLARTAYTCPQCQAKNADLPADCAVCGLKLVLAPHLARSFHHLFPVPPFTEAMAPAPREDITGASSRSRHQDSTITSPQVTSSRSSLVVPELSIDSRLLVSSQDDDQCCYACLRPFAATLLEVSAAANMQTQGQRDHGILRFKCPECHNFFCVDCDAYLHETLHNCPGCLRQ